MFVYSETLEYSTWWYLQQGQT